MNSRSSLFVLVIGFGILVVLIATLGVGAVRRTDAIYRDMQAAQDSYSQTETFRRGMVLDMYLADILVRDYLLDPSPQSAPHHREELLTIRDSLQRRVDQLSGRILETHSPDFFGYKRKLRATGNPSTRSLSGLHKKRLNGVGCSWRVRCYHVAKQLLVWPERWQG